MAYLARRKRAFYLILTFAVFFLVLVTILFALSTWTMAPSFWKTQVATKSAKPSREAFSFLVFGDSGVGSAEQRQLANLMGKEDFDFILHTGDLAYQAGTQAEIQTNVLEIYKNLFEKHPFYPTLGNHDYGTANAEPYLNTWALPAQALNDQDQKRYYSFDRGGGHFVSLDSNAPLEANDATSEKDMFDWLRSDLAKARAKQDEWLIVYFHHPPFSSGKNHGEDKRVQEKLVPIFEDYGVDLVLSGHEHNYERTCPINISKTGKTCTSSKEGITYIVSGGGGNRLYGFNQEKSWFTQTRASLYHFLKIRIDGCNLTQEAIDINQQVIDTFGISKCN